jgi:uncharacterized protein
LKSANILPQAALERHIAILGKTGSGKSNTAKVIAERLMKAGERVCAIDPTGTWWGVRLAEDGKRASKFAPVIFGGNHADIQITADHGAAIAEAIATSSTSAIIDTRLLTVGARTKFFTNFGEALLRMNRGALHLIIDEAHLFAPQGRVNDPQSGAMLHAANNLVSLGRGIGLRIIMISQRPAKLHKDSLTQAETLIAMRLIAPQDRKAIEDWIGEWAEPGKGKEIVAGLPSLPTGTAWVWSPEIDMLEKVKFPLAATFDSGQPAANGSGPHLAPIDVDAMTARLETIKADVIANDPARMRKRIAELEKQVAATPKAGHAPRAIEEAEKRGYERGRKDEWARGSSAVRAEVDALSGDAERVASDARSVARRLEALKMSIDQISKDAGSPSGKAAGFGPATAGSIPAPATTSVDRQLKRQETIRHKTEVGVGTDGNFTNPEMKVLRSIAMWRSLGNEAPTKVMVAGAAGYSPKSGGFANLLSRLRSAGALEYPGAGTVKLLASVDPMTRDEAREAMFSTISAAQRKLFDALVPGGLSKRDLAEATGYSASSGGYANLLSSLRSLSILEYPQSGHVALAAWVYDVL